MDYHSFNFPNYIILIMYRLYLFMGTDRTNIADWVMIAQLRTANEIQDKRNRLISNGHNPKDIEIVRLRKATYKNAF